MSEIKRSIPACAGELPGYCRGLADAKVYPRVCGGTARTRRRRILAVGLSPRVRGNPTAKSRSSRSSGSIPACAGEPTRTPAQPTSSRVYPRVCGGTCCVLLAHWWHSGLSPRVRGNHQHPVNPPSKSRSIPACAGEPPSMTRSSPARRVYPRVCGGTRETDGNAPKHGGLSPRVRGNRGQAASNGNAGGSIPACAGEPKRVWCPSQWTPVYPRVCGGTRPLRPVLLRRRGLSPRVRGNRLGILAASWHPGSIPACAGEPEGKA